MNRKKITKMKEEGNQSQASNSLTEKKKFLFFLRISVHNSSLKNHTLIAKMKKEIAREMTLMNADKRSKNCF